MNRKTLEYHGREIHEVLDKSLIRKSHFFKTVLFFVLKPFEIVSFIFFFLFFGFKKKINIFMIIEFGMNLVGLWDWWMNDLIE